MRSRNSQDRSSKVPQVNLTPMLDVLMSVLTFFIILSMSLTGQGIFDVDLPKVKDGTGAGGEGAEKPEAIERFVLGLNRDGAIIYQNEAIEPEDAIARLQTFLAEHPDGAVTLNADRTIDYAQVDRLLQLLQENGETEVSLVIE
ncbi:hypothetical protein AY599_22550 [Leptolyngbya valderiana BDU 20041]|nr:biopolymer transporter ExbD [Geitlerinema sp. CS-897]OAB55299.1 hypothetical protein AY599_22550 [Leptolyngbya valderiana BDU 20041]PPT06020.1 Biopolymer transport protein ExbD/TolR [Geitlerinema sp. FC II]